MGHVLVAIVWLAGLAQPILPNLEQVPLEELSKNYLALILRKRGQVHLSVGSKEIIEAL